MDKQERPGMLMKRLSRSVESGATSTGQLITTGIWSQWRSLSRRRLRHPLKTAHESLPKKDLCGLADHLQPQEDAIWLSSSLLSL
jgi:hypothetical protein